MPHPATQALQGAVATRRASVACVAWRARALPAVAIIALGLALPAWAHDAHDHSQHKLSVPGTKRMVADYRVPEISLQRDDGRIVSLKSEIEDGRPVVLAFVYTSCTTVCPVTSAVLGELQSKLGSARERVHLMSISIDPEHDTPSRLREYAQRFAAGPDWQHYTGTVAASRSAQRAFDVYRGDKMSHTPVVLVRPLPGARWVRIDGFATAGELMAELPEDCRTASLGAVAGKP
jgi:protein SCO1/2